MQFPQDTPIQLASISELTIDQLEQLVVTMRERRMRSYTAYQAAQEAKAKIKEERDRERYEKVLQMAEKKFATVDAGLTVLSKYVAELKVLELTLGE